MVAAAGAQEEELGEEPPEEPSPIAAEAEKEAPTRSELPSGVLEATFVPDVIDQVPLWQQVHVLEVESAALSDGRAVAAGPGAAGCAGKHRDACGNELTG